MYRFDSRIKKIYIANKGIESHFFNSKIVKKQMKEAQITSFYCILINIFMELVEC